MAAIFATVSMQMAHAQVTAKLAYVPTEDHPVGQGVNKFIDLVKTKSNGKIIITPYSGGKLGSEPQLQSSLQGGTMDIMVGPTSISSVRSRSSGSMTCLSSTPASKEVDAVMDPVGSFCSRSSEYKHRGSGPTLTLPSNTLLGTPHGARHTANQPKAVCI